MSNEQVAAQEFLLGGPRVQSFFGVSAETIRRWRHDKHMNFPVPIKINGRLYWRRSDLNAWLTERQAAE